MIFLWYINVYPDIIITSKFKNMIINLIIIQLVTYTVYIMFKKCIKSLKIAVKMNVYLVF